jgi:hypothetical protein
MIAIAPFLPTRKAAVVEGAIGMGWGASNWAHSVVLCVPTARAAFPHASRKIAPRKCAGKQPNTNYCAASPLHGQSGIVRQPSAINQTAQSFLRRWRFDRPSHVRALLSACYGAGLTFGGELCGVLRRNRRFGAVRLGGRVFLSLPSCQVKTICAGAWRSVRRAGANSCHAINN